MRPTRRDFLMASAAGAMLADSGGAQADDTLPPPFPQIADTSAASRELVEFMTRFFTAKTKRLVDETMSFFAPDMVTYIDATLGLSLPGFAATRALFQQDMPLWPASAKSYPTRLIGDMTSALVAFTDTPELFGGEVRSLGTLDFKNGKIVRWVDTWDARGWPNSYRIQKGVLTDYGQAAVGENASARLRDVVQQLSRALNNGSASAAASLYSSDAVYEDMGLRSQIQGRLAIERYLTRSIGVLPNGVRASHRHTVGSERGGAYEWNGAQGAAILTGTTALVLDSSGLITRSTSVFDSSRLTLGQVQALAALTYDPA